MRIFPLKIIRNILFETHLLHSIPLIGSTFHFFLNKKKAKEIFKYDHFVTKCRIFLYWSTFFEERNHIKRCFLWHFAKAKAQNSTWKGRIGDTNYRFRILIRIYFHSKVLFSQGIRTYSCFTAEKKGEYVWFVGEKRLLLQPL